MDVCSAAGQMGMSVWVLVMVVVVVGVVGL